MTSKSSLEEPSIEILYREKGLYLLLEAAGVTVGISDLWCCHQTFVGDIYFLKKLYIGAP
jgi:hypothetical protein